jgi:CRP/FNR family transcriptional regulator
MFNKFSTESIQHLLMTEDLAAKRIEFEAGQTIHEATDPADQFYFIESGEVRLFHVAREGAARLLDILGRGDWVGTAALARLPLQGKRAVAVSDSVIWSIPSDILLSRLGNHSELAAELIETMAQRLQDAWSDTNHLMVDDCRLRLIRTLLRFSTSSAASPAPQGVVLRITHAQLAQAVGAARETISVYLTELRQKNIVRTGRNRLFFDPRQLRELETGNALTEHEKYEVAGSAELVGHNN